MSSVPLREVAGRKSDYWSLVAVFAGLVLGGLAAAYYMEHQGHWVTGMDNQIVWGTPHIFAVFLIVSASGALNVASLSSAFGKAAYKPLAPLSGLLAIALLMGGLMILVLDLGRPDRLIVAMTHYNFKSIFAWNIFLYTGFMAIVGAYLWTMLDRSVNGYTKTVGTFAMVWRLALTTGTGCIFGFLVARAGYDAAVMAPMFIALSLTYGTAIFLLVLLAAMCGTDRPLGEEMPTRLRKLLALFIVVALYFVALQHLTNIYATEHDGFERFILVDGGSYSRAFWVGQIAFGSIMPLALITHPATRNSRQSLITACLLVIAGGLCQMYVTIIGGQAYPLEMFPGMTVSSGFYDGAVTAYTPSLPEILLGLGGVGVALLIVTLALKHLRILPVTLENPSTDDA
ncbi:MAG: NrfD/PsrC family molybdoenzyme membrane anchor subunit [Magnetospiraceae bacterium]